MYFHWGIAILKNIYFYLIKKPITAKVIAKKNIMPGDLLKITGRATVTLLIPE